jgi:membrane-associated phospholipid phosphatase
MRKRLPRYALVLPALALALSTAQASLPLSPPTWPTSAAAAPDRPAGPLFTRGDAWFAAATVASIALATRLDRLSADEVAENNGAFAKGLSRQAERLGSGAYAVPALLAVGAVDALGHRGDRLGSLVRVVGAVGAAGVLAAAAKIAVGRARPYQAPGDPDEVRPFSGDESFPSGHTTIAFGIAAAIDRETSARWVPFVAYPLAGLVGWSRMRDRQHWLSDVVAGAALGTWTARKAVDFARRKIRSL